MSEKTKTEKVKKNPLTSMPIAAGFKGVVEVDGDKSISHRSILFNAIANGEAQVSGVLEGEDVIDTIKCMQACGVKIEKQSDASYKIKGVGLKGLKQPKQDLYFGNSGTSARLFMGILAGQGFAARLLGDESLNRRDMKRVIDPLSLMGAKFAMESKAALKTKTKSGEDKQTLPLTIQGSQALKLIEYKLPMASAQVKSAILLAGLNAVGTSVIVEKTQSRNHSELMLKAMGANIVFDEKKVAITGGSALNALSFKVAGDPSSAAFIVAGAILTKGGDITIKNVCINPTRTGFYKALKMMGAKITLKQTTTINGEPVGEINAKYSPNLKGVDLEAEIVPSMVDEFPIFSIIASFAEGKTKMVGLKELTTKESNRIIAIANGLSACGVSVNYGEHDFSLVVYGDGINRLLKAPSKPIATQMDHRIAMSFIVAGLKSQNGIAIDDSSMIKTSFPSFATLFTSLGGIVG